MRGCVGGMKEYYERLVARRAISYLFNHKFNWRKLVIYIARTLNITYLVVMALIPLAGWFMIMVYFDDPTNERVEAKATYKRAKTESWFRQKERV